MIAPAKITFYCRPKDSDGIRHTFPVDSTAKHDTAKDWASRKDGYWSSGRVEPEVFEFDNEGFDHVTIVDLTVRSEGGRAYQVIIEKNGNKYKMDLRERTLMDVIELKGIQAGGRLNGTFCFIKEGSQTNVILEGTEAHKAAVAERKKRESLPDKPISRKDLKVGHVYKTATGQAEIFLGFVYACSISDHYEISKPYKAMLFSDFRIENLKFLKKGVKEEGAYLSNWHFKVTKSHSHREEGEKVLDLDQETIVERLKRLGHEEYMEAVKDGKRYSSYFSEYTKPYILSKMELNKKDVDFKEEDVQTMVRCLEKYRYGRRW
ncbi:hypothetical protein P59_160 [Bacillus phage P59]|nr:hypothetical protein P59_160 [Bacillus phage P59]